MRAALVLLGLILVAGCDSAPTSDDIQQKQQESILAEGTSQVGMPAVKNFRERKMLKDIIELRDQAGLVTYTYMVAEMTGKLVYIGETVGYGIPYATQYTNPQKFVRFWEQTHKGYVMPQADPNGLFSPENAEGTWILLKDPHGGDVRPVYVEPRIIVSPFKLDIQ